MGRRAENQSMGVITTEPTLFDSLLGDLLDMCGMRVSVTTEPGGMIATGEMHGATTFRQKGHDWVVLRVGGDDALARVPICRNGLQQSAWIADAHASSPEKEVYAVIDHFGEREVLIVLEPGQPHPVP
jgi:hypothetical protein